MSTHPHTPGEHRRYSAQFKAEAVQMVIQTRKTVSSVARSLGISPQVLGRWVRTYRDKHPDPGQGLSPLGAAKLHQLEEENQQLRMENEFLKKAAAFFARTLP